MRRRSLLPIVVAAGAVAAFGFVSGSTASSGQTAANLNMALNSNISVLDDAQGAGGFGLLVEPLGTEDLMNLDADGNIVPWLAQSVRTPNPFTYIYTLRKGVRFWNGAEMTAVDVANAMNYYRFPTTQTAHYYSSVRSIVPKGRYTVVVTLKKRDAGWPIITATHAMIFEKKFADAHKGQLGRPGVGTMGTGPWIFGKLDPTSSLEMSANPHYWGGKVPIQHVSVKFIDNSTTQALAIRAGDLDFAPYIEDAISFASTSGSQVKTVVNCGERFISMNVQQGPWADVHVRRAVSYALSRPDIIRAAGTPSTPLPTYIPPITLQTLGGKTAVDALIKQVGPYQYSLAKAKAEMAKSSTPNGFSYTLPMYTSGNIVAESQVIAAQLKQIGINMTIDPMPIGQWLGIVFGPREKIGMIYTNLGCVLDPSFVPGITLKSKDARAGALNVANYKSAKMDTLIASSTAITNKPKRLAIYGQILKQLSVDVPYIGVFSPNLGYVLNSKFVWNNVATANQFASAWLLRVKPR